MFIVDQCIAQGRSLTTVVPETAHIKGKWFTIPMNAFSSMLCASWLWSGNYVESSPKPFVPRAAPSSAQTVISMPFSYIIHVTASMVCWSNSSSEQQCSVMIYHSNISSEGGSRVIYGPKHSRVLCRNIFSCARRPKKTRKFHFSRHGS